MNTDQSIRAFIAIPIPQGLIGFFTDLQKKLKKEGFHASWPRPDTLHLTLKFLGDIKMEQVDDIKSCMTAAVSGVNNPIELSGAAIGVFPTVKNPRVIWAGIQGQTHILGDLVKRLDQLLNEQAGIRSEKRKRFSPHLTLARVKSRIAPKKMVDMMQRFSTHQSDLFTVHGIQLYKSQLNPTGAVHTSIFTANF